MDVAFDVVYGDERKAAGEAQRLGVGEPDQKRPHQARPHRGGDGGQIFELRTGAFQRLAHHRHDGPQMLARGQLRNDAAILAVGAHLRGDHGREYDFAIFYHGCRGLVARGFNAENAH